MEPLQTQGYTFLNDLSIISEINNLKLEVDAYRPLDKEKEARIMQKFRLDWNYNSNAIEGNSLDYGETLAFLMHGITAKGKPLKDYLDIRGHNEAINFLQDVVRDNDELREADIRALHKMLLVEPYQTPAQTTQSVAVQKTIRLGEYKRSNNHVITITGETHYYATAEDTPMMMTELMDWYRTAVEESILHPIVIASIFHHKFTSIHPFDDGNGRMSRLLMNLILMKYAYPPVVIKNSDKKEYYLVLSQADSGDIAPFVEFIGNNMLNSLNIYIKGAKGESIEEPSDLRKKITLFKKEVEARRDKIETKKSHALQKMMINDSIIPFFESLIISLSDFHELFLDYAEHYIYILENSTPNWNYEVGSIKDFIEREFAEVRYTNDDTTDTYGIQFLRFKLADNPFSVEVKITIEFLELSCKISYAISEAFELQRINSYRSLYSQWSQAGSIEKYYHQQLSKDDIDQVCHKIGELFLTYTKSIFDNQALLESKFQVTDILNLWNDYLLVSSKINENSLQILKNYVTLSYNRNSKMIGLNIPTNYYVVLTQKERITIEEEFSKAVTSASNSLVRTFVNFVQKNS